MSWDRAAHDAFNRLRGYSQEYLDDVHKLADDYRAAHGPPVRWEPASSSSSFSDADLAPLSPPKSPKRDDVLDLSHKAWGRRVWSDLSIGMKTSSSGFGDYETWKSHMLSEHAKKVVPTPSPLSKLEVRKKQRRPAVTLSERLTRSKVSTGSLFYELGHDGKTGQALPITYSIRVPRSRRPPHATKASRKHKRRL